MLHEMWTVNWLGSLTRHYPARNYETAWNGMERHLYIERTLVSPAEAPAEHPAAGDGRPAEQPGQAAGEGRGGTGDGDHGGRLPVGQLRPHLHSVRVQSDGRKRGDRRDADAR